MLPDTEEPSSACAQEAAITQRLSEIDAGQTGGSNRTTEPNQEGQCDGPKQQLCTLSCDTAVGVSTCTTRAARKRIQGPPTGRQSAEDRHKEQEDAAHQRYREEAEWNRQNDQIGRTIYSTLTWSPSRRNFLVP